MSKATESIFDGKDVLIPLAEVNYILKFPNCIEVHFKGSAESVTLVQPDQNALISAWCRYRSEVEADTLMDLDGAQPAPSFADAYQGAMEEVAIWKIRALEAEDLNRKFIDEINGPTYMGEPTSRVPSTTEVWLPIPEKHPTFDLVDLRLADGSVLCGCAPQIDGDYWWNGPSGEVFIDPKYAPATHWRLSVAPEAKPCP